MGYTILEITSGTVTNTVKLINRKGQPGFHYDSWFQAIALPKGGGVWENSPLGDGRHMVLRRWDNVIETINLTVGGSTQDEVIAYTRQLRGLLEQARDYWKPRATVGPVWIKAQSDCEEQPRYAYIYDYSTPNDGDPYGGAFNPDSAVPVLLDPWPLFIERGHWLDQEPGSTGCIELSSRYSGYTYSDDLCANGSFETAGGGGADVFAGWAENAGTGTIARSNAGSVYLGTWKAVLTAGAGLDTYIQQDLAVVAGQVYYFGFAIYNDPARYQIIDNTAGVDIVATVTTSDPGANWRNYGVQFTIPAGCISLRMRLRDPGVAGAVAHYDSVTLFRLTSTQFGRSSTCDPEVMLVNKTNKAQLTHAFTENGGFSANLIGAALPYNLVPAGPAANDRFYVGISDGAIYRGPFNNVIFDILPDLNLTGDWEYWNGAWTPISNYQSTAEVSATDALGTAGVCGLTFEPPTDWARTTVNGIYGWWIRFNITAVGAGANPPQQQYRQLYTVLRGHMDVAGAIGGDIPLLTWLRMFGIDRTPALGPKMPLSDFVLYSRSLSRGSRFNSFINIADQQQETEITFSMGANMGNTTDYQAPTGRAIAWTPAGAGNSTLRVIMAAPLTEHYTGTFRIMVRAYQSGGAVGDLSMILTMQTTKAVTSERIYLTASSDMEQVDFGKFSIPAASYEDVDLSAVEFQITCYNTNGAGANLTMYDLILIPTDESVAEFRTLDYDVGLTDDRYALIDSTYPKSTIKALEYFLSTGYAVYNGGYQIITTAPFALKEDGSQIIGIVFLDDPLPWQVAYSNLKGQFRYLSMRGDS